VDEKTIQALDRRDPVLPLSPGRAERHGFEYVRHGALSLYAALNVGTGEVEGMTAARHTSADFLAFLDRVVLAQPKNRDIHLITESAQFLEGDSTQAAFSNSTGEA
jgi:DDE superfamily endonuclease